MKRIHLHPDYIIAFPFTKSEVANLREKDSLKCCKSYDFYPIDTEEKYVLLAYIPDYSLIYELVNNFEFRNIE